MRMFLRSVLVLCALAMTTAAGHCEEDLRAQIDGLSIGKLKDTRERVRALAATGDPRLIPLFESLAAGNLFSRLSDGKVYRIEPSGDRARLVDPLTGETVDDVPKSTIKKIRINNGLRRLLRDAIGELSLMSSDPSIRRTAAEIMYRAADPDALTLLEQAIAGETDAEVMRALVLARASAVLNSGAEESVLRDAIATIARQNDRAALSRLYQAANEVPPGLAAAVQAAIGGIERKLVVWDVLQNVWYGLSLGSVLLLAAIGLAITFGVMGVINMAHGEMVMLGAYTTYVVQQVIAAAAPGLDHLSLLFAVPLAFVGVGALGFMIERFILRFLYGRPLETLLATWGLSLLLQQSVRTIFGASNKEVANPTWMSGAFEVGNLTITANRLWIAVFALAVFFAVRTVLNWSRFGLQMRAVTQNRGMASSMGIRTSWVDGFTFALGSGIAGMAGVALSQIDNVSPNLGQGYIIDSFMVVVFGGVGNLWGTLIGALTLGVANKLIEPAAGAVLAKIAILVCVVLFIQKRPRGLFALRGRAVEA